MGKFINIIMLDAECFNDPKAEIHQDNDGNPIEYDSIKDATVCGIEDGLPKFVVYKKVTEEIINLNED